MGTCTAEIVRSLPAIKSIPTNKRERRSVALKRQIVEETLVVGASVARVARVHGVNANQVLGWRLYEAGKLGKPVVNLNPARWLPVSVAEQPEAVLPLQVEKAADGVAGGTIHLEMRKARVRIEGRVDPELVRLVLRALQG